MRFDSFTDNFGRKFGGDGYDETYFARKHGLTRQQVRDLFNEVGLDRDRLNEAAIELKKQKRAES